MTGVWKNLPQPHACSHRVLPVPASRPSSLDDTTVGNAGDRMTRDVNGASAHEIQGVGHDGLLE